MINLKIIKDAGFAGEASHPDAPPPGPARGKKKGGIKGGGRKGGIQGSLGKENLVSWWTMDEDTTADRVDSQGGNDLTPVAGGVPNQTGVRGNEADFNGSTHYMLNNSFSKALGKGDNDWSWAGWITLDAAPGGTDIDTFFSLTDGNPTTVGQICYYLTYDDALDAFTLKFHTSTNQYNVSASTYGAASVGTRVFFYVYHDALNNEAGISINNGVIDTTAIASGTPNSVGDTFEVGRHSASATYLQYVEGAVDELCHFDKILSTDDVTFLYQSGKGVTYSNLTEGFFSHRWESPSSTSLAQRLGMQVSVGGDTTINTISFFSPTAGPDERVMIHRVSDGAALVDETVTPVARTWVSATFSDVTLQSTEQYVISHRAGGTTRNVYRTPVSLTFDDNVTLVQYVYSTDDNLPTTATANVYAAAKFGYIAP